MVPRNTDVYIRLAAGRDRFLPTSPLGVSWHLQPLPPPSPLPRRVTFVKLSSLCEHISWYEHFLAKREVVDTGSPAGHIG